MRKFITSHRTCRYTETVSGMNMEEAIEAATQLWSEKYRDGYDEDNDFCEIDIYVEPVRPRKGESRKWTTIEVGMNPDEPNCVSSREHHWKSQRGVIGGEEMRDGAMIITKCCCYCGAYEIEKVFGSNPWCEGPGAKIYYENPDSNSLLWVEQQQQQQRNEKIKRKNNEK